MGLSNEDILKIMPGADRSSREIDLENLRDLTPLAMDDDGRLRILPAAFWASTTTEERAAFGHRNGLYSFPTIELVERLREIIDGRSAIEVGAGHGALAEALDITATDNFQQQMPKYRLIYAATRQPTVPYGPNVIGMHASRAVRHYKPQVVIGAWITHKYDPEHHERGGNEIGVDERDVLLNCEEYVLVGNEKTHLLNPIWARKHTIEYPDYVYSRAHNGSRDFIARFPGVKHR